MIMKGIFTISITYEISKKVVSAINSEMPVAPPSMKLLGSKKPLSPKLAEKTPASIHKASMRLRLIIDFLLFTFSLD